VDETTWTALALVLTLLAGGYTFWAFRHRGTAAGLRGLALTLIPPAAWATGTLEMFTRIVNAIVDWITDFVFSPLSWAGIGLAGIAVVLYVVGGMARSRSGDAPTRGQASVGGDSGAPGKQLPSGRKARSEPVIDPELAEIEALLKKRGIT
jgi:predicted membrane protein